jgi:TRAP-type C4-dicarboxylate transport system permease large subunit
MYGMLAGVFSPTEAGAMGALGAFVYARFRGRISWPVLIRTMEGTAIIATKLLVIVIGVGILGSFLASSRLPFYLADWVTSLDLSRYYIYSAILLLYILLGCVMNVIAIILLTLPAIFPTILALGFDPVWFGVISVILMEMGQITPPIGIIVFAMSSVSNVPMESVFRGVTPFVLCMLLCIVILTFFPEIALFLPRLLFGS